MIVDKSSHTAESAAALRAIHMKHYGEPKILDDPFAIKLTSPYFQRLINNRFFYWLATRNFIYGLILPASQGQAVSRARYTEDRLQKALAEGVKQYVILGAGLDSFALRRQDLADTLSIFEVDHPATQQSKQARLVKSGLPLPKNVTYIKIDFDRECLVEKLTKTSYSSDVLPFFSWLGTIPYLTKDAIRQTLEAIASLAPKGSELIFDYMDADPFEGKSTSEVIKQIMKFTKRRREPMITGFHRKELIAELSWAGFELIETLSPGQIQDRYFKDRTDGLMALDHWHFACARVL